MSIIEQIRTEIERRITDNTFGAKLELIDILAWLDTLEESEKQMKQQEVNLEKFTDKMDAWKARYNHPDNIPIKATMTFTARMFYMYPKVAREWYKSLPKATQD